MLNMSRLTCLSLLLLMVAVGHGEELTGRDYWNSVLPDTPMPNAISELLHSDKQTSSSNHNPQIANPDGVSVGVGSGGVGVRVGPGKENPGVRVGVGAGGVGVGVGSPRKQNPGKQNPRQQNPGKGGVSVGVGHGGIGVGVGPGHPNPRHGGVNVGVGHGGIGVGVGPGHPNPQNHDQGGVGVGVGHGGVGVGVGPGHDHWHHHYYSPYQYHYAASETQLHADPSVALFFLEKDLKPSTKMTLHFTKTTQDTRNFIPRSEADKLPFSSSKFPQIVDHFKISKDSDQAEDMKQTLKDCETPAIKGEKKYCATSLESMVDFTTSSLKTTNVSAFSTNINPPNPPKQEYEISKCWIIAVDHLVACHREPYPYAVYYCHEARATKAYTVNMVGKDGSRVESIAVCHTDTKSWNPKHLAFQILKIEPGSKPVCHFLPQDHVVWTRSM